MSKSEQLCLRRRDHLRSLVQIQDMAFHLHSRHMFFRPEEYGVHSIVSDDVPAAEMAPVDLGQKQARVRVTLAYSPSKPLVYHEVHWPGAMRAHGRDLDLQALVSKAPFDEGRSEGVLRSSPEDSLSGAETQPVRSLVRGYGKGPTDVASRVTNKEKQVLLQILKQIFHGRRTQP
jgi:hypothetical protein